MVGYLIVDTELSALEAIVASKRMMEGHKFEYFCLVFSFIGWNMLALPTAFFIYLWLFPYMVVTFAIYYDQLKNGDQYLKDRISNAQDADINNFDDIYAEIIDTPKQSKKEIIREVAQWQVQASCPSSPD